MPSTEVQWEITYESLAALEESHAWKNWTANDTYGFTITVQPKGMPVAGEPLDLEVTAEVSPGLNWLSEQNEQILVYGLTGIGALLVVILFFRSRAENRRIIEALEHESSD